MSKDPLVLGIDIGGTKLAVGAVGPDGSLRGWRREPARKGDGPDSTIERLIAMSSAVLAEVGHERVPVAGVGCGGPLDAMAGVVQRPPNLPGWLDVPVVERLRAGLGMPVHLDNDANAAVLAEHRFGAGRGRRDIVYLTISTGIGGGAIVDDRLLWGATGNALELGHMSVDLDGWQCSCGRRGCLEAFASGTNIGARARRAVTDGEPSILPQLAGGVAGISSETVTQGVRRGDALAIRIWRETIDVLAAGLTNVLNIFEPELIILGGGVTRAGDLLFVPLRRQALGATLGRQGEIADIVPAELGEHVGVYGAAAVAMRRMDARAGVPA